jgi:protein-glutamine gamma-glutamyltransferase
MNRRIKDGIVIDHSVTMIEDQETGFPFSVRIVQFLTIFLGGWSVISILMECFQIPASVFRVCLAVLLTTAVLYPLYLFRPYDVVKQFFCILFYGLFFYSRFSRLKNGFYILENLVLDRLRDYYGYNALYYRANYSAANADTTLFVIMVLIPLVALLGVAVIRGRYISFAGFAISLPVCASFAFGMIPSETYLLIYVITMLYLYRSGKSKKSTVNKDQTDLLHRINSRAAIWLSLLGIGIFFLMKLIVTPKDYEGVTQIEEMKAEIQTAMYSFSIEDLTREITNFEFGKQSQSTGGLSGGSLGKIGQVKYTNTEHLKATVPLPSAQEGIYLKGYVGTYYTGDRWEGLSNEDKSSYQKLSKKLPNKKFQPVNQVNQLLDLIRQNTMVDNLSKDHFPKFSYSTGRMKLQYKAANKKFMYAPYFTDYESIDHKEYRQDLYAAPTIKNDSYVFDYLFNIKMNRDISLLYLSDMKEKFGDYSNYEKLYRDYVYRVYTKLPTAGLERIKQDFTLTTVKSGANTIPSKIDYVKKYLSDNTRYSLSPGKLPKGKDFVEYFLYENKSGYCAHYASAATLMLRSMGVPARYVEGYAVNASDIVNNVSSNHQTMIENYLDAVSVSENTKEVTISVRDYNAHAWVEVYIDNCGWLPVEFTPGSSVEFNNTVVMDIAAIGENIEPEKEDQPKPTKAPEKPTPTEKPEEIKPTTQPKKDTFQPIKNETKDKSGPSKLVLAVSITNIVIAVFLLASYIVIMRKRAIRRIRNRNKRAIILFAEMEKILAICDGLPKRGNRLEDSIDYVREHCSYIDKKRFTYCVDTVRKARFGRNIITYHELSNLEEFHNSLYQNVYNDLPWIKRLYLKLIMLV